MNTHNRWKMRILRRVVTLVVCTAVLMGCASQTTALPHATGDFASVTDIASSIVQLRILDDQYLGVGTCTGTIIDPRGIILTNFHCVANTNTKQYENPDKMLEVYITKDYATPPLLTYYAQVTAVDADADVAVLQIVRTKSGATPTTCLTLPSLTINPAKPAIEDAIRAVGYPGFGQSTLTVTDGKIAGLSLFGEGAVERNGSHVAIKTTTIMGHGISGGALINSKNELIGVPFYGVPDSQGSPGTLNYAVAVGEAQSIIDEATKNPKPGCDGAPAVTLQREIQRYPMSSVMGRITYLPKLDQSFELADATIYFFAPDYDVKDLLDTEIDAALARTVTNSEGGFSVPLTAQEYEMKLGIVVVYNNEIIMRENGVSMQGAKSREYDNSFIQLLKDENHILIESSYIALLK